MNTLANELDRLALLLKELTPATLTADQISAIQQSVRNIDIEELISRSSSVSEHSSDNDDENNSEPTSEMLGTATRINKKADAVNDELDRIKKIRNTLNLEALDPVIQSVRKILHPVYNFTAELNK